MNKNYTENIDYKTIFEPKHGLFTENLCCTNRNQTWEKFKVFVEKECKLQTMREEWSSRNYASGKTDIVPSISSSCSSFDREPLYGNVMKKSNIIWAQKTPVNDAPIRLGKHINSIAMRNVEIFGNL